MPNNCSWGRRVCSWGSTMMGYKKWHSATIDFPDPTTIPMPPLPNQPLYKFTWWALATIHFPPKNSAPRELHRSPHSSFLEKQPKRDTDPLGEGFRVCINILFAIVYYFLLVRLHRRQQFSAMEFQCFWYIAEKKVGKKSKIYIFISHKHPPFLDAFFLALLVVSHPELLRDSLALQVSIKCNDSTENPYQLSLNAISYFHILPSSNSGQWIIIQLFCDF